MNRLGPIRIGDRLGPRGRAPRGAAATWRRQGDPTVAWIKLDDKFAYHRKFRAIEPIHRLACIGLWSTAIGFAQHFETDGHIRPEDLAMLAPPDLDPDPKLVAELVRVTLWDVTSSGWKVHDFEQYNMLAAERARLRSENAARATRRQQRWRRAKKRKDSPIPESAHTGASTPDTGRRVYKTSTRDVDALSQPHQTETQTERENPPLTPPVALATEPATGPDPSLSLSVKNPDSPDQETAAMSDDAEAESRERQGQDDTRHRELGKFADWAERHGYPEVAAQVREQAKTRRPMPTPPPNPGSPHPDTVKAILAKSEQTWNAFFACNRRGHPGHSDLTCPDKPPHPGREADAQARAEFGPGADDPVDEPAP
jgi:hypothetical protein